AAIAHGGSSAGRPTSSTSHRGTTSSSTRRPRAPPTSQPSLARISERPRHTPGSFGVMGAGDVSDPFVTPQDWPGPPPALTVRGALRRTFGSLDSHNYRLFFFGDLVSYIGSWMQTMAEAWVVWSLTKSGSAVGATFAFRFLPVLLFGLWGGAIADRFDRRKVLLVTQTL